MGKYDDHIQAWVTEMQPRVPDPIRGILGVSRAGALGNLGVMKLSPATAMSRGAADKRATGLPENVAIAITDTELHVFSFRPKRKGLKLKDQVAIWPREGMTVASDRGAMTIQFVIRLADGREFPLEANKMSMDFNGHGLTLIGAL